LNWREVCDGHIDCWGNDDEQHCSQLEMAECQEDEYRCRNGQCIPEDFLRDNYFTPDCLDTTDEILQQTNTNGKKKTHHIEFNLIFIQEIAQKDIERCDAMIRFASIKIEISSKRMIHNVVPVHGRIEMCNFIMHFSLEILIKH
jgi:hypothetical protein